MTCKVRLEKDVSIISGSAAPLKSKDPSVDSANVINAWSFPSDATCETRLSVLDFTEWGL